MSDGTFDGNSAVSSVGESPSAPAAKRVNLRKVPVYVLLVLLSILFFLPFVWMFSSSLKFDEQVYRLPPTLVPDPFRWQNYPEALTRMPWGRFTFNTIVRFALPNICGNLLACSVVAYGFSRIRWRWREPLFYVCIATMMIPFQVTMIPLFLIYTRIGWTNSYLPLVVPAFLGSPYYIFLLRQFFLGIPEELSDAARIDGCNELGILTRIILPLSKPALMVISLFVFMGVWHDYLGPLIYLNRQELFPIALGLEAMRNVLFAYGSVPQQYPYLMAVNAVFSIPIIVFFFFAQRTFIEGIALTGIKG